MNRMKLLCLISVFVAVFNINHCYAQNITGDVDTTDASNKVQSFTLFWEQFITSILTADTNGFIELVADTLEVKGYEDADPILHILHIERHRINYVMSFVLHDDNNRVLRWLEQCKDYTKCNFYFYSDNTIRVGDMSFGFTKNGYKLTRIYTDTRTLQVLLKNN